MSRYPHHEDEEEQVGCVACHDENNNFAQVISTTVQVNLPYQNHREMTLAINDTCRSCHEGESDVSVDSAHADSLRMGNQDAPVCVDCHGGHEVGPPAKPRNRISTTCRWFRIDPSCDRVHPRAFASVDAPCLG